MIDRSRIGFATEPTTAVIEPWRVKLFRQAIGEGATATDDDPVPPTFLKAMEGEHCSSAALLELLGIPVRKVLHAEQSFELLESLHVGDAVQMRRCIADVHDKKDGALTFVVVDTDYRVAGRPVASSRQTIVVRNA
jgi:hypothetical protein